MRSFVPGGAQIEGASLPLHRRFFGHEWVEIEVAAVVIKADYDQAMSGAIGEDEVVIGAREHILYKRRNERKRGLSIIKRGREGNGGSEPGRGNGAYLRLRGEVGWVKRLRLERRGAW